MQLRVAGTIAMLALVWACADSTPEGAPPDPSRLPNILLISIDTLRADHLGSYGYARDTSPAIDRLAAQGILFERSYSHSPKTAPSHMSLLTGLYPDAHGVVQLGDAARRLSVTVPTLASILQQHGYRTAAVTAGGNVGSELGFDRGMDSFEVEFAVQAATRKAIAQIEQATRNQDERKPFFLFFHTYEVHDPYLPLARFKRLFADPDYAGEIISSYPELVDAAGGRWTDMSRVFWERVDAEDPDDVQHLIDLYDASIRLTDDQLAVLFRRMRKRGLLEETIIVLSSDHGEEFREHGRFLHERLYQEHLHVPLIISLPGRRNQSLRVPDVVRLVDVLPTVLDAAGLPIPAGLQGVSLLPLIEGRSDSSGVVFSSWRKHGLQSLRVGNWKLIQQVGQPSRSDELYDLSSDPSESHDLSADQPERTHDLAQRLGLHVRTSKARQVPGTETRPSQATADRLKALGYVE